MRKYSWTLISPAFLICQFLCTSAFADHHLEDVKKYPVHLDSLQSSEGDQLDELKNGRFHFNVVDKVIVIEKADGGVNYKGIFFPDNVDVEFMETGNGFYLKLAE
ncbi:MAG: hypothetical protein ABJN98_01160 [Roseibium sp.]|uniref:hypothetical protein n=1 Tax=Parasphingorhabdus sp. TaxID=2709688 RepID=UPI003296D158